MAFQPYRPNRVQLKFCFNLIICLCLISFSFQETVFPAIETNNQYQKYYRDLVTAENLRNIDDFNNDKAHSFKLKQNKFISMKNDEFYNMYTTNVKMQEAITVVNPISQLVLKSDNPKMKGVSSNTKLSFEKVGCDSVNVDLSPLVSPVKDQGRCQSCYAHSTLASIEVMLRADYGITFDLSEQQITQCSTVWAPKGYQKFNNDGCNGGWGWKALAYVQYNGVTLEQNYPYTAGRDNTLGICNQTSITGKRFKINGLKKYFDNISPQSQCNILNERLLEGKAIAVSIWVPEGIEFQFYGSQTADIDIFNICGDYEGVNHELLLVGSTDRYWKLKNSFGLQWGQKGYLYLDKSKGLNCLNVCMDFSFPLGVIEA